MAVGLVTILVRYKKQKHSIIRVIRREGGMYFMSALSELLLAIEIGSTVSDDTFSITLLLGDRSDDLGQCVYL